MRRLLTICALVALIPLPPATASPAAGQTTAADDSDPFQNWVYLRMKPRGGLFLSGRFEVHRLRGPGGEAVMETRSIARFMGAAVARQSTRTRIDPDRGHVSEYLDLQGRRGRRYRFHPDRYEVEKMQPVKKRPIFELPPLESDRLDGWNITTHAAYDYPPSVDGDGLDRVYDHAMLMRLAELPLSEAGDRLRVQVATTRGPQAYQLTLGETRAGQRRIRWDTRRKKRRSLEETRLTVRPEDPETKFLGMQGEVEIWVEARSKTILSVSGKIPKVPGRVTLELVEIR